MVKYTWLFDTYLTNDATFRSNKASKKKISFIFIEGLSWIWEDSQTITKSHFQMSTDSRPISMVLQHCLKRQE